MADEITSRKKVGKIYRTFKMYQCQYCGREFEGRTDIKRKYCSRECSDLARTKQGVRVKGRHAYEHKCEHCGKDYWSPKKIQKYCSAECQRQSFIGSKSPVYKRGNYLSQDGYKWTLTGEGGYEREHRLIVEKALGRKLVFGEDIHHINGDKTDNRLENLVLLTRSEHAKIHHYLKGNGHTTFEEYEAILNKGKERIKIG